MNDLTVTLMYQFHGHKIPEAPQKLTAKIIKKPCKLIILLQKFCKVYENMRMEVSKLICEIQGDLI